MFKSAYQEYSSQFRVKSKSVDIFSRRNGFTDNQWLNFLYKYINNFQSLEPSEVNKEFTEKFINRLNNTDTISKELYNEMKLFCSK
jgi:hypothetical protein